MVNVSIHRIGDEWIGKIMDKANNYFYISKEETNGQIFNHEIYSNKVYSSNFDNQDIIELRKRMLNFINLLNSEKAEKINYSLDYVLDPEAKEDVFL